MAEPVDPADDFVTTRGNARAVGLKVYDPANDVHGAAVDVTGVRGPKRVETQPVEGGTARVTTTTWTLTGVDSRPPLHSEVVDGADTWVIDAFDPDPLDAVYAARCTLLG